MNFRRVRAASLNSLMREGNAEPLRVAEKLASPINIFAVAYAEDKHNDSIVLNIANDSEFAHAVPPEFPQAGALQWLPETARIVQQSQPRMKKLQYSMNVLRVELVQLPVGCRGNLNLPRHGAS